MSNVLLELYDEYFNSHVPLLNLGICSLFDPILIQRVILHRKSLIISTGTVCSDMKKPCFRNVSVFNLQIARGIGPDSYKNVVLIHCHHTDSAA